MEFYNLKLIECRKKSRLTADKLSNALGICRTTYWRWEKGLSSPNKEQSRLLSKIMEIPVSKFTDLESLPEIDHSSDKLTESVDSWVSFFDVNDNKNFKKSVTETLQTAIKLSNNLNEAGIIIKALVEGINSIFYIKNSDLKYITANKAFLDNLGYDISYRVSGKTDSDFFNKIEALENNSKDERVLLSKEKLVEEGFIPGSRKKRWGIISRVPIFDVKTNIVGIISNIVDITEIKRIDHINQLLKTSIDNLQDVGISIFNTTAYKIVYANSMITKITGYTLEEFYNKKTDLSLNTICDEEEKKKALEYREKGKWPKNRILQVRCKDNSKKWIKASNFKFTDFLGDEYMVLVVIDLTDKNNSLLIDSCKTAKILKENNVAIEIISKATGLPQKIVWDL